VVYLLVNALDEINEDSRKEFLQFMDSFLNPQDEDQTDAQGCRVKWLFLSRSRPDIEQCMCHGLVINMDSSENSGFIDNSVKTYVSTKVAELAKKQNYSTALGYYVKSYLQREAGGDFLWVNLVCKELENLTVNHRHVRRFLEGLPFSLSDMYECIWRRVSIDFKHSIILFSL